MHLEGGTRRMLTFSRPQVAKITAPVPGPWHTLEHLLSLPLVRGILRRLTARGPDGKCLFERLSENYDRPEAPFKWRLATRLIDFGLNRARWNRQAMKQKLFHHPPTVKALALTARSIAHYGLTAPQRYVAPLFIVWNFTQACNLTCKHCYQDATRKPESDELSLAEKIGLVDQMADAGVPFLAIAGGEPLVSRDLWPVLEHAHRRGIHLTLATNGTLIKPETVERLKLSGVKYVEISVDSSRPQEHDAFRGVEGAWERAVQGVKNCVAGGMRTGFATCFTRRTIHRADEMVNLAIGLGCATFSHFNFIPVGRGREMFEDDITPGQRELLLCKLTQYLQEGRITVISTAPQFGRGCAVYGMQDGMVATGHVGRGAGRGALVLAKYIGGCGAGRCYCSVQPNGTITPCVYMSTKPVGSIRERSLVDIWNCELFGVLSDRDDRGDHCGVCDYRAYCGGCRARALSYTDDVTAGDPGCSFNYHEWKELRAAAEAPEFRVLTQAGR